MQLARNAKGAVLVFTGFCAVKRHMVVIEMRNVAYIANADGLASVHFIGDGQHLLLRERFNDVVQELYPWMHKPGE